MVSKRLLSLFCVIITSNWVTTGDAFLQPLNDDFGHLSNVTHRRLVFQMVLHQFYMRIHNSALLEEVGRRIPTVQQRDAAFLASIMEFDGISEECRDEVLKLRDDYVLFQNSDIRSCVYYTWTSLNALAKGRFWFYFYGFTWDATRAASQVLRTLEGRKDLLDAEGLREELLDELEQYQILGEEQLAVLEGEVRAHQNALEPMKNDLRECFDTVDLMQITDHELIMDFLRANCY